MPRRRIKRLSSPRSRGNYPELPRHPLLSDDKGLDEFVMQSLAAGVAPVEILSQLLPSVEDQRRWEAERHRADRDAATAKRMARKAALDDPVKREAERQRFQAKLRETAQSNAARDRRIALKDAARAAAVAANPTLVWRKPRRKGWTPDADYARGGRRKNTKKILENAE